MARIKYKEAVGLEAKKGKPAIGKRPEKAELKKLYVTESKSIREIAEILGCSKDMVHRSLKKYGIDIRRNASRSRLRIISLQNLEAGIKAKGIRGLARDLGVDEGTIRHHLKVRRREL